MGASSTKGADPIVDKETLITIKKGWRIERNERRMQVIREPNGMFLSGKHYLVCAPPPKLAAQFKLKSNQAHLIAKFSKKEEASKAMTVLLPYQALHLTGSELRTILDLAGKNPTAPQLHLLALAGQFPEAMQQLLNQGYDVNTKDSRGNTALHALALVPVRNYSKASAKALLNGGAEANTGNRQQQMPLHLAAHTGNDNLVQQLIEHKADVNVADTGGSTPLMMATQKDHIHVLNTLLNHSADVQGYSRAHKGYILHLAAMNGSVKCLNALLRRIPNEVNRGNPDGETALHFAVQRGKPLAAHMLLEYKANTEAASRTGRTPLHYAALHKFNSGVVGALLAFGAKCSAADAAGDTPLHIAARNSNKQFVELLCTSADAYSIDLSAKNKRNETVLSVNEKDNDVMRWLLHVQVVQLQNANANMQELILTSNLFAVDDQADQKMQSQTPTVPSLVRVASGNQGGGASAEQLRDMERARARLQTQVSMLQGQVDQLEQQVQQNAKNEAELERIKEQLCCTVCLADEINVAFIPCGHACTCVGCADALNDCPLCRKPINDRLRIFSQGG